MKKILSICFLWVISCALWGQGRSGYGGDFNPDSPDNPKDPSLTLKYDFKITAEKGGTVNYNSSISQYTAGSSIYLNAEPYTGYQFKCWLDKDSVISTSQWHYYTMPARDVELKAVFVFQPQIPDNPEVIPLDYRVSVEASPSNAGNVDCSREEVKVGTFTYVSASPYNGYKFMGWMHDGKLVSRDSYYHFQMESRNMHFTAIFEFKPDVPGNPSNNPNGSVTYLLKYMIDGQVCHTEQLPEGAPITTIATPTKKGHTFSGWSAHPTLMPANEVVISGTFIPNKYHISYMVDDNVIHEEDIDYGSKLTPPEGEQREGYSLIWQNMPEDMPDYDIVVEGTYVANTYDLTYIIDGVVYKTYEIVYGTGIIPETSPVKEGHTFSGWNDVPETMPASDVVVTGSFTVNRYKITYMVDGAVYATDSISYGTVISALAVPVKEGHTFSGWNDVPETMPASDVVVTGSFSVNSYKITYMVDGAVYATDSVSYGTEITTLAAPVKEGHTFSGWSEAPETMPANDVVVTGSFSVNSYKITYMIDGAVYATDSISYGTAIEALAAPVKEGHTFSGWSDIPETMPAEDIVITGSFTVNRYKITYMVDGELHATDSISYGAAITTLAAPVKEGHTFSGWNDVPETMPANDVVVTGSFSVNSYKITYMVDGAVYATDSIAYGTAISALAAPVKEGHTFSGWSEIPETMPAEDIVITGSFTVNRYKITYMVDGAVYATDSVSYGTEITTLAAPVKEGHTFSGWSEVPETMPANDIVVTGSFTVNRYKITYMVDGAVYATDSISYGTVISALAVPVKEGHTFSGWNDVPETMPASDVVVTGSFSVNSYKITYMVDGAVHATDSISYGTAIEALAAPVKEGHTFSGWSDIPETMPASDVVVTGTFTVNRYKITYMVDDAVYATDSISYGTVISALAVPVKEGHTFSGWSEIPETMPAEDIVITGTFAVNSYKITYMVDGAVYATDSISYGQEITSPEVPTKEGYTFSGWSDVPETMPAEDVVCYGEYIVNIYKVYYYVGDELVYTEEVAFGEQIPTYEYTPTNGDKFIGWDGEQYDTMPSHDVTYIANIESGILYLSGDMTGYIIFDLNGRRIENTKTLKSGIYIVNGKKTIVKVN